MEWSWAVLAGPVILLGVYFLNGEFREEMNTDKVCAFCASKIPKQATTCKYCAKDQTTHQRSYTSQMPPTKIEGQHKRCGYCSVRMPMDAKVCLNCLDNESD